MAIHVSNPKSFWDWGFVVYAVQSITYTLFFTFKVFGTKVCLAYLMHVPCTSLRLALCTLLPSRL